MWNGKWNGRLRSGYLFDEVASALQKSIRRGLEFESLYWSKILCDAGYDLYCWKRLCIVAVEDVGLADIETVNLVKNLRDMWVEFRKKEKEGIRLPETNILTLAILKLCRAPKNRVADDLAYLVDCQMQGKDPKTGAWGGEKLKLDMPEWAIDGHTDAGKERLKGEHGKDWYVMWNKEFYEDCARTNNPVEVEGKNWSKLLMEKVGCSYEQYVKPVEKESVFKSGGD